jgi:hypothetical protein
MVFHCNCMSNAAVQSLGFQALIPTRIESDSLPKEGKCQESSSFLKKRTKKLLLASIRASLIGRVNQQRKSLLVLFFRKELLPRFAGVSVPTRVGIILHRQRAFAGSGEGRENFRPEQLYRFLHLGKA